ncbi:MAG TPA: bifunctional diguanylate cyclase/phosphodiesterase [Solirubrobacterales bacterium]|nr:bifunctional diguanylate cyclase/phosphodiesterase [Solirubrobacterales bacterium]
MPAPKSSWTARRADDLRRRADALGFGVRLFLTLFVALAIVGGLGYVLISDHLEGYEIDRYSRDQRDDAKGFEDLARKLPTPIAIREIDELLDAIGRRSGTQEALLISPANVVRASAEDRLEGRRESDPRIDAALASGAFYSGHETDPLLDSSDFEFVTPVRFPGGLYALTTSYDSASFDAHVDRVRRTLLLVILLALVGIAGLFYLLGGRTLLRHHRLALQRATRDGLTDLPNHRAFDEELAQIAAAAARNRAPLALALLDLDHFKLINDRYGHPQGDELLRRVAGVLRDGRSADRGYRIGGDEFALLLLNTDEQGARILIQRLSRTLTEAEASASIGVAQLRPGLSAEELRAQADAALYEAKRRGGKGFAAYEEIRDKVAITTSAKREAVRRLVEERRFETVFQPIWNLASGELIGLEALTRPDPSYELSGPREAFDIAEQIGAVADLDEICATQALRRVSTLPEGALLFVNLAPKTLELDPNCDEWLQSEVERAGLAPEQVVAEVTERIGARTAPVLKSLERLRGRGFKLALDDVGTGNAGLEMLRKIGAEYVKIDRSIVAAAATEPNARAVLMAMATFARQSGAFVIADGIEDEETLEFLRGVEALDARPGTIIQGGQGFELGQASVPMAGARDAALPVLQPFG